MTTEERSDRDKWIDEKYQKGLHPTIVFKDPTDDKVLIVMTEDENRSGYVCELNYELRAFQQDELPYYNLLSILGSLLKPWGFDPQQPTQKNMNASKMHQLHIFFQE